MLNTNLVYLFPLKFYFETSFITINILLFSSRYANKRKHVSLRAKLSVIFFIFQAELQNSYKWYFEMSQPHFTRTRSEVSKPFPAKRRKRHNDRPGRYDTCIVTTFNGDQPKMPITCDTAQVYKLTSLEKLT